MKNMTLPSLAALVLWLMLSPSCCIGGDRFTDNGDGTVTDHEMGLMWAETDNQGDVDWKEAQRYCRVGPPEVTGKYDNWRMPTVEELATLYAKDGARYETDCGKTVSLSAPIKLSCAWVWTSEIRNITAVVFNFQRGYKYTDRKVHYKHYRALPVRDLSPK